MRSNRKNNIVMIADDDLFVRKVIRSAFNGMECDIHEVIDGAQVARKPISKPCPMCCCLISTCPTRTG
jgi:hypothetical protein